MIAAMILPDRPQRHRDVALHYDELDPVYRALWGAHVHHGLWRTGRETPAEATQALSLLVSDRLGLGTQAAAVADIGCGYGETARLFARRFGWAVTGFTLSAAQAGAAPAAPGVEIRVRDWLDNDLADGSQDGAYAIESSEHMEDKPRFFAEAARVLKPGGRLAICAWLEGPRATGWQKRHLLAPICREGRLPSMGSRADYLSWAKGAGLRHLCDEDLSKQVARTWTICAGRFARAVVTDRATRAIARQAANRDFALSLPRLMLAYRSGAMRYGLFLFEKPV